MKSTACPASWTAQLSAGSSSVYNRHLPSSWGVVHGRHARVAHPRRPLHIVGCGDCVRIGKPARQNSPSWACPRHRGHLIGLPSSPGRCARGLAHIRKAGRRSEVADRVPRPVRCSGGLAHPRVSAQQFAFECVPVPVLADAVIVATASTVPSALTICTSSCTRARSALNFQTPARPPRHRLRHPRSPPDRRPPLAVVHVRGPFGAKRRPFRLRRRGAGNAGRCWIEQRGSPSGHGGG